MAGSDLPRLEAEIDEYEQFGTLNYDVVVPVILAQASLRHGESYRVTPRALDLYRRVLADRKEIDRILSTFAGSRPLAESSLDVTEQALHGYTFHRTDFIGRHRIVIERASDRFQWVIGIEDKETASGLVINGYYHISTNGNIADIRNAFENTKHLFPETKRLRARATVFTYDATGSPAKRARFANA